MRRSVDADATKPQRAPKRSPKPRARREVLRPATPTATGLLAVTTLLTATGMVMLLSSSVIVGTKFYGWFFVTRQLMWVGLALTAMLVCWRIPYTLWRRWTVPILGLALLLLVLVIIPGLGKTVDGATRWLEIGPISVQPSEPVKFAFAIFCADVLTRRERWVGEWRKIFFPLGVVGGGIILLVMLQPDMGTSGAIVLVGAGVLIVAGVPFKHLRNLTVLGLVIGGLLAWLEPYRRERLLNFMHPFAEQRYMSDGWQLAQSLIGIGSGGLTGVGLGQSRAKWGFLPNAHTDFIFAIIAEEGGLIGVLFVLGLFVIMTWLGVRAARRAPDRFGMLLASGITTWLIGQAYINMAYVIGAFPVTGIPLPFVSNGGSALIVCMAAMGVLASIARAGDRKRALERVSDNERASAFAHAVRAPLAGVGNGRPVSYPALDPREAPLSSPYRGGDRKRGQRAGLFAALVGEGRRTRRRSPSDKARFEGGAGWGGRAAWGTPGIGSGYGAGPFSSHRGSHGRREDRRLGAMAKWSDRGQDEFGDLHGALDAAAGDLWGAMEEVAGRTPRGGHRLGDRPPLRVIDGERGGW